MKAAIIILAILYVWGCATQDNPVKEIVGNGLHHQYRMYVSDSTNRHDDQKWYFYANVLPTDSLSVIGHEEYYESENKANKHEAYAFIVHNKNSESHRTFSEPYVREWRDNRMRDVYFRNMVDAADRNMDGSLLEKFGGFWVFVRKYQGEFYLHQDWTCLMARELTDSTWVQIDWEVTPRGIKNLRGTEESFAFEYADGDKVCFQLVEPEREVYRVNDSYMIPVRRIHDFKLIAYCNIADMQDPFVEFDE